MSSSLGPLPVLAAHHTSPPPADPHAGVLLRLDQAIRAMSAIYPAQADYATQGTGAYGQAVTAHRERLTRLKAIHDEIVGIARTTRRSRHPRSPAAIHACR